MRRPVGPTRKRTGFTLAEALVVVLILGILAAIAVPNVIFYQRLLRMQGLDHSAQEIFLAAQNRLTARKNSGTVEPLSSTENAVSWDGSSEARLLDQSTIGSLLPAGTLEGELASNYFYLVYDEESGSVLAVVYSEDPFDYDAGVSAVGQSAKQRVQVGTWIGWYTGDPAGSESIVQLEAPSITILNGEKLIAEITVTTPSLTAAPLQSISLTVTVNGKQIPAAYHEPDGVLRWKYTFILDSLAPGEKQFKDLGTGVAPGDAFTLTAKATCSASNVLDSSESYIGGINSLFADGSSGSTAQIACGRHLQNLDPGVSEMDPNKITAAVQRSDLHFDEVENDSGTSWYACYNGKFDYIPVNNLKLDRYDGGGHTITGLTVDAAGGDAGLFGTFSGSALSNIRLVNPKLTDGQYAGGLAAQTTNENLVVDSCQVYYAYTGRSVKDALGDYENVQISAAGAAGGLIGKAASVQIKNSFAAGLIRGGAIAGGLVGSGNRIALTNSYADCYLWGSAVGGLAGRPADAQITSCYAAGFVAEADFAAGLALGSAAVHNSYSAMAYLGESTIYPLIESGTTTNSYYLSVLEPANEIGEPISAGDLEKLTLDGFEKATGSTSKPYNLMEGMALTVYTFPKLAGLPHYGDWRAEFQSGALVYYEEYADDSYGFYGANVDLLKNEAPVSDGYAIASSEVITGTPTATYNGSTVPVNAKSVSLTATVEGKEVTYHLLPLPAGITDSETAAEAFYQEITLTVDGAAASYWFNPHFAKTAVAQGEGEAEAPDVPSPVSVRTPRHFLALSACSDTYAPRPWSYVQEQALDYGAYRWSGTGLTKNMTGTVKTQAPIGASSGAPFAGTYSGGARTVSGISVAGEGSYIGLFGYNTGNLRGVLYVSDGAFVSRAGSTAGRGVSVYLGGLAGRNAGTITGCAVAGLELSVSNAQNSTVYLGGLVGENLTLIRQCAAACDVLQVTATQANAYAAGFAGANSGTISQSYAQGAVRATRDAVDVGGQVTCFVTAAGFTTAGGGSVSNSYCAVGLYADGGAETAAFSTGLSGASNSYLTDGNYTYGGEVYSLTYADGSGAVGLTQSELATRYIPGMATSYETDQPVDDAAEYPYPVLESLGKHYGNWLKRLDLGDLGVYYWEKEEKAGQDEYHFYYVGLTLDDGGSVTGTTSHSTLCGYHDDGGVITEYGYGYYNRNREALNDGVTLTTANLSGLSGAENKDAKKELEDQMEGQYTFQAYNTFDPSLGTGLYPSGSSTNGTFTLNYSGKSYSFTVSPFFAQAIQYSGAEDAAISSAPGSGSNPYGVRSVRQLQLINWNSTVKNCTQPLQTANSNADQFPYLNSTRDTTRRYWSQNHDLDGSQTTGYQPIAAMYDNTDSQKTNVPLWGWFGGTFRGNDYAIKDLNIKSNANTVGLFGLTMSAELQNIVMYSTDGTHTIEVFGAGNQDYKGYAGWYALGGLVGLAAADPTAPNASVISNCAISGYTIRTTRSQIGEGGGGVGGLVGICSMNLSNCTAVTDIKLEFTHTTRNLRVGGLAGTSRQTISDCYAGGSIRYGESVPSGTNVYVAGIAAGYYMKALRIDNDTDQDTTGGKTQTFSNCYSYVDLTAGGRSGGDVHAIGSLADHTLNGSTSISKCYILSGTYPTGATMTGNNPNSGATTSLTYEEFSNGTLLAALGSGYAPVTASDANGNTVNGKYTFPSDARLRGRDYPFPTILTQQVTADFTAHLHYGDWPEKGLLGDTLVEVDLIATHKDEDGQAVRDNVRSIQLRPTGVPDGGAYEISDPGDADIAAVSVDAATGLLTVTGKAVGFTEVAARYTVGGADYHLVVEVVVTAAVNVAVDPASTVLLPGGIQTFASAASDKNGNPLDVKWIKAESNNRSVAEVQVGLDGATIRDDGAFTTAATTREEGGDAVVAVSAQYTDPDTRAVFPGQGLASITVVPVTVTAEPLTLGVGQTRPYPAGSLRVSVQDQAVEDVTVTGVTVLDAGVASGAVTDGTLTFTGLAEGTSRATLALAYVYQGVSYTASTTVELTVVQPDLASYPSELWVKQRGSGNPHVWQSVVITLENGSLSGYTLSLVPDRGVVTGLSETSDNSSAPQELTLDGADEGVTVWLKISSKNVAEGSVHVTATPKDAGAGAALTLTIPVHVYEKDLPAVSIDEEDSSITLYGGQSESVKLELNHFKDLTDCPEGYECVTFCPDPELAEVILKEDEVTIRAAQVKKETKTSVWVTVRSTAPGDTYQSSARIDVTILPAPVLTAQPAVLALEAGGEGTVKLSGIPGGFTLKTVYDSNVIDEAELEDGTLTVEAEDDAVAGSTTTVSVLVMLGDVEISRLDLPVVILPELTLSLADREIWMPAGGDVSLSLNQTGTFADAKIKNLSYGSLSTKSNSGSLNASVESGKLRLTGTSSAGTYTVTLTAGYSYDYDYKGLATSVKGTQTATLTVHVFEQITSTAFSSVDWWTYSAKAEVLSPGTVTVTNGPSSNAAWSSVDGLSVSQNGSTLSAAVELGIPGVYTVLGEKWPYSYTLNLTVHTNPKTLTLTLTDSQP